MAVFTVPSAPAVAITPFPPGWKWSASFIFPSFFGNPFSNIVRCAKPLRGSRPGRLRSPPARICFDRRPAAGRPKNKKRGEGSLSPARVFSHAPTYFFPPQPHVLHITFPPFLVLLVYKGSMRAPSDRFNLPGNRGRLDKFSLRRGHFTTNDKTSG